MPENTTPMHRKQDKAKAPDEVNPQRELKLNAVPIPICLPSDRTNAESMAENIELKQSRSFKKLLACMNSH